MTATILAKGALHIQRFIFRFFLALLVAVVAPSSLVALHHAKRAILDM